VLGSFVLLAGCTLDNPAVYERANQDLDGIQMGLFGVVMLIILFAVLRAPDVRRKRRVEFPVPSNVSLDRTQHLAQALLRTTGSDSGPPPSGSAGAIVRAAEKAALATDLEAVIVELRDEDRWMPEASRLADRATREGVLDWIAVERDYTACLATHGASRFVAAYAPMAVQRVASLTDQLEICHDASAPFWLLLNGTEARLYPSLAFLDANVGFLRGEREVDLRRILRGVFHIDIGGTNHWKVIDPAAVRVSERQVRVVSRGVIAIPAT